MEFMDWSKKFKGRIYTRNHRLFGACFATSFCFRFPANCVLRANDAVTCKTGDFSLFVRFLEFKDQAMRGLNAKKRSSSVCFVF